MASSGPRAAEEIWQPHQLRRLLGSELVAQLIRDYEGGDGCTTLARRYGVSENGVLDQLKRMGVQLRPRGKVTANQVAEMRRLRDQGWTYSSIGERYGITRWAVKLRLDRTCGLVRDEGSV